MSPTLTRRLLDRGAARPADVQWEVLAYRIDIVADRRGRWRVGTIEAADPVYGPCGRAEALTAAMARRVRFAAHPVSFRVRRVRKAEAPSPGSPFTSGLGVHG